ncbi:hypothetical protein CAPTEDRAFT_225891 [Capitella teleta]|uniref:Apple domain-containing protein n=1 Tax=Capitella teleta TaxID=283909 RepID=R7VEV6_CAPTE|nr:hypothetical protein CAPTEDRAFT_225891 [Capitella teleta]|eukprot:ELU14836.1 hypothetical protein CAPTEDRAFT_225891 [Capitella teleta]
MDSFISLLFFSCFLVATSAQISMISNGHLIGGTQQIGITNLGDCIQACSGDSRCLGLDFNSMQSTCWFHFTNTVCSEAVSKIGCTHFRFTECPLTTFVQGISSFPGRHVGGGTRQSAISTIEGCAAICAQSADCQGFDFDIRDGSCWTHTTQSVCTVFREKQFCTHYRLIACSTTTDAPDIAPGIEYTENFRNLHIFGGNLRNEYTTLSSCYQGCYADRNCQGFDWNSKQQCWFHFAGTVCATLTAKAGCTHYRIRANCAVASFLTCTDIGFYETTGSHRLGGTLVAGSSTNALCQLLCRARADCAATDFDIITNACYLHTSTGIPIPDDCCIHSQKQCNDFTTTLIPTTPTPGIAETTTPTVLEQTTILDSGKCPAEFLKFPSSTHGGGNPVSPAIANTAEECKQYCLDTPICVAVDFNDDVTSGTNCFYHTNIQPNLFMDGTDACCTHFRRIDCAQKQCYVHPENNIQSAIATTFNISLFLDAINIRPDGNADLNVPYKIERGCDPNTKEVNKNCISTVDSVSGETTMRCSCNADECNAFGMTLLEECQAYFPLDCTVEDNSPYLRNVDNFIYPNIKFDSLDAQKNWSAVFDGSAYIQIPAFSNFQFGSVGTAPNFVHNPAFSITMWVKRTGLFGRQVILSNGGVGSATVEIVSNAAGISHSLTASFQIRGTQYRATTPAIPLNQWSFVSVMVTQAVLTTPPPSTGNYYVQIIVDDTSTAAAITDTGILADPSVTGSLLIDTSSGDLCIGKQYQANSNQRGDFFVGELDEIWFFSTGLLAEQLDSIKGVSLQRNTFFP